MCWAVYATIWHLHGNYTATWMKTTIAIFDCTFLIHKCNKNIKQNLQKLIWHMHNAQGRKHTDEFVHNRKLANACNELYDSCEYFTWSNVSRPSAEKRNCIECATETNERGWHRDEEGLLVGYLFALISSKTMKISNVIGSPTVSNVSI